MIIMKGSVMVNEISLSDSVALIIDKKQSVQSALELFAEKVEAKCDTAISFCEIFGKRWSFIAGTEKSYKAKKRQRINSSYGMIYEKGKLAQQEIEHIKELTRKIVREMN